MKEATTNLRLTIYSVVIFMFLALHMALNLYAASGPSSTCPATAEELAAARCLFQAEAAHREVN